MRCPRCGTDNPDENPSCVKCFKLLSTDGAFNSSIDNSAFSSAPVQSSDSATQSPPTSEAQASAISTPFKPGGNFGSNAPGLMLIATLLGAPLIGLLYSFVAQYVNLLLISQLIAGALLGGLLALAIKTGKCRNTRMVIACGSVGGLLLFSTCLFANSMRARSELIDVLGPMLLSSTSTTDSASKPVRLSASQAREMMSQKLPPLRFFSI